MSRKVAEILCRRDGVTMEEAFKCIKDVLEMMEEVNYDPLECEEIMATELGLEPDYIFDLLL